MFKKCAGDGETKDERITALVLEFQLFNIPNCEWNCKFETRDI